MKVLLSGPKLDRFCVALCGYILRYQKHAVVFVTICKYINYVNFIFQQTGYCTVAKVLKVVFLVGNLYSSYGRLPCVGI